MSRRHSLLPLILLVATPFASGQTATGTILGTIRDPQNAPIPGARVVVTNAGTNVSRSFTTDMTGSYAVPFLPPGEYAASAEAQGFRRAVRSGMTLRVEDRLTVNFEMEIGLVTDQVSVRAATPLLETTGVLGQVIENRRIVDLPLNGREPFSLAQLAPGVVPVPRGQAPIHQGGAVPSINGASNGTSEVLLDGATNTVPRNRIFMLIHTPSVDAVEEFKVQTNSLSAEYGKFNGGVITLVTKSGTNTPHGSGFWFHRNSEFDANDFFNNRNGIALGALRRHQAGFTLGGPVMIPKVYKGKDRTFFFADYEAFREAALNPGSYTVPTAIERSGDFSRTLNTQGRQVVIYDPQSLGPNSQVRTAFAGNVIPASRVHPVARKLMDLYPATTNDRVTGNLAIGASRQNRSDTFDVRIDHNLSSSHRLFTRLSVQNPYTGEPNYYGNIANPGNPPLTQYRRSAALQTTHVFSSTLIADLHYGFSHMFGGRTAWSEGYDITQLGFAAAYRDTQQFRALPIITAAGYSGLGNGNQNFSTQTSHGAQGSLTKIRDRHTFKAGAEYRAYYNNQLSAGSQTQGTLTFGTNFTQGPNPNQASATAGNGIATFLLGHPGGAMRAQPATAYRSSYQALYFQDDWRVNSRLTLNLGLRYEINQPRTDRWDRISVFDPAAPSPIAPRVPGVPNLRGAMSYRDSSHRRMVDADGNNFSPRFGLAWQALRNTVVRTGYGLFYGLTPTDASTSAFYSDGFSVSTSIISSLDGVRPVSDLTNPFPSGVARPLPKSALGPDALLGQAVNSLLLSFATPYIQQWNFSIQQAVAGSVLVEAAYAGSKGTKMSLPALNVNTLTADQQALGTANQQLVPNPFFGVITDPTSSLSLATVQRGQLLRPFPQYSSVSAEYPSLGNSQYHSFQMKVEKRFSRGFTVLGALTAAKTIDDCSQDQYGPATGIQDPTNLRMERSLDPQDVSKRLAISGIWNLPLGRGRALGRSWSKPVDLLLGGWQFNAIASFQSGLPLAMASTGAARPNRAATGNQPSGRIQDRLDRVFDISAFAVPAAFTFGNSSRTAPDLRSHGISNFDLSLFKSWQLVERLKAQFRLEAFNAFNRAQFSAPGTTAGNNAFGVITSQFNVPRQLQLALKLIF